MSPILTDGSLINPEIVYTYFYMSDPTQSQNNVLLVCIDEARSKESVSVMKDLEILGSSFSEVHIAVFSTQPFVGVTSIDHPKENVWIYHVSHFPILRYISFSFFVKRHLMWQGVFRPTHILSYGSTMTSYLAARLAKKYTKPLTVKIGIHDATNSGMLSMLYGTEGIYKRASHLIVEGGEKAKQLKNYKDKIIPMTPFFDFEEMLGAPIEPALFNRKYSKDFFFISHFEDYDHKAVETVCQIMKNMSTRYIKGGHIIFVPYADMKKVQSTIRSYGLQKSVFVEPERADMLPVYKGARIYIHTRAFDQFSIPVLFSLTLGVPVITTPTGYIEDMYKGTTFERFVIEQNNIDGFCEKIMELVEKDFMFNDYKMNTPILMKSFPHEPLDQYIAKVVQVVLS